MQRQIKTNLIKKGELFNVLALAEATGLPVLLIGPPGVAKTATVMDYAKASKGSLDDSSVFMIETDEGTKTSAIKGTLDMKELVQNNNYTIKSPIADANFVIINEVDKASPGLRDSLLGVMNEKVIFNGTKNLPCKWEILVATCNKIPEDEIESPFWDRFALTYKVDRLREAELIEYFKGGGKNGSWNYTVHLPDPGEVAANLAKIDLVKVKKTLDLIYKKLSDRTISSIPLIAANAMAVYQTSLDRALIKTVELLVSKSDADLLAKNIMDKELRVIYDKIDMVGSCLNNKAYLKLMSEINTMGGALAAKGKISADDKKDLARRLEAEEAKLDFLTDESEEEEVLNNMM